MTPEEEYGVIKAPDSPLMAKAAELFRGLERRVEGSPAEFILPGGGIAQVLERKAYGEDPSAFEYGMAGLDVVDIVPGAGTAVGTGGQVLLGAALAGPKAIGKVGDQIKKATELFGKKRDEFIKDQTGVIRTLENQPGAVINSYGRGGTKLKENATDKIPMAFDRQGEQRGSDVPYAERLRNPASRVSDYIDWPNLFEEYPEAANLRVEIYPSTLNTEAVGGNRIFYDPEMEAIYIPASIRTTNFETKESTANWIHDNDKFEKDLTAGLAEYVDAVEGRLQSKFRTDVAQGRSPAVKEAKAAESEKRRLESEGPLSPQKAYELAQRAYPGEIERATTSDVFKLRNRAQVGFGLPGSQRLDEDSLTQQTQAMQGAYGERPNEGIGLARRRPSLGEEAGVGETLPLEVGRLQDNLPRLYSYETGTFESPLLSKVEALKQEKGSGDQFLGALKKTNPNPEDFQYSGLETYLRGRKNVTKDEITEYLTERAIPLKRNDSTFYNNEYVVKPFGGTKFKEGSEHSNPRTLEIVTQTDPISGVEASRDAINVFGTEAVIPGYHRGLSPNTIGWARYNERLVENPATGDSFDALFIDEIQSDWHQRGKKVADIKHTQLAQDTYPELYRDVRQEGKAKYDNGDFEKAQDDGGVVDAGSAQLLWEKNEMRKRTPELREQALKDAYNPSEGGVPDAPFKKNWHELTLREVFREAIAKGHDGVALSTNAMQSRKYSGRKFNFYDGPLRSYMSKFAKRYGSKVETYELPQVQIDDVPGNLLGTRKPVKAGEQTKGQEVFYMPITDEMREWAKKPVSTYAKGGGVRSLAPIAKDMYRGYDDVKRGVASYIPYMK